MNDLPKHNTYQPVDKQEFGFEMSDEELEMIEEDIERENV